MKSPIGTEHGSDNCPLSFVANQGAISLKRRNLLIAGALGSAVPSTVLALNGARVPVYGASPAELNACSAKGESGWVISGRVLGANGEPLAAATVTAWSEGIGANRARLPGGADAAAMATTDADGRFVLSGATATGRSECVRCQVSHGAHAGEVFRFDLSEERARARESGGSVRQDENGLARATVGITLS